MHALIPACCGSFCSLLQVHTSEGTGEERTLMDACTYTASARALRFVSAAFCKCTPPGTGEERTRDACTYTCVLRFVLQPSASAHLRGQVKNGPRDACTYTCVLRLVFAAFCKCTPPGTGEERTPRCMHLYRRAAIRFCSLLQVHTSGDR